MRRYRTLNEENGRPQKNKSLQISSKLDEPIYITHTRSIDDYLDEIRKYPILSQKEEKDLLQQYKETHDMEIRNYILMCHQRFVYAAAKAITRDPHLLMDLVNEGNIYFVEAIDRFDESYDNRLLSYAQYYIKCGFYLLLQTKGRLVTNNYARTSKDLLNKAISQFCNTNFRYPTDEEIKYIMDDEYGITISDEDLQSVDIIELPDVDSEEYEFDNDYEIDDQHRKFIDRTSKRNDFEDKSDNDYRRMVIDKVLSRLDDNERRIIEMTYGIGDYDEPLDMEEICYRVGLTRHTVLQKRQKALQKMERMLKQSGYGNLR